MLFKGRCKLFSQSAEEKVWKERGVGMLTLRKPRGDGGKPYLVFTTESGRCAQMSCSHRLNTVADTLPAMRRSAERKSIIIADVASVTRLALSNDERCIFGDRVARCY